ncbi:MAG: hypothetical protein QW580_07455, partial [Nitrososphaerota archaeon]
PTRSNNPYPTLERAKTKAVSETLAPISRRKYAMKGLNPSANMLIKKREDKRIQKSLGNPDVSLINPNSG